MPSNLVAQLARKYRKLFPHAKFRIKRGKLSDAFATTHLQADSGTFVITLDSRLDQHLAAFLVAHEFAHCISWNMDTEEHGEGFWAAYRKTYSVYEDFVR